MRYIYELPTWPEFRMDYEAVAERLAALHHRQGRLMGRMEGFGFGFREESQLRSLTRDVVKTSEIEGEVLNTAEVRSSLARRLGIAEGGLKPERAKRGGPRLGGARRGGARRDGHGRGAFKQGERHLEGVVAMTLDATRNYQDLLTVERLFGWHAGLFPGAKSGLRDIRVGAWRDDRLGPMQVVSGPMGRERVHFEAPAATLLDREMAAFLAWFNGRNDTDWVMKAALAHLWFLTVHPFDDGNGRIARAVADLALARSEQSAERFYSMSAEIYAERSGYYEILERTQKGSLDVTEWVSWFLDCLSRAIEAAQSELTGVLNKGQFWDSLEDFQINERQRKMLNWLMDGFEGKLTTSKWGALAKCSQDTALRDILELVDAGVLVKGAGGGRSTGYELAAGRGGHASTRSWPNSVVEVLA